MARNRLFFDIGARDKTGQAFSSLHSKLERTEKRLESARRQFTRVAAAAGAAGVGLAAMAIRAGNQIDRQAKLARVLGTSTESMQTLARAAELSGVSFNEVQAGVTRLTRRLSLAAQNMGPAAGVFQRLGLRIEELQALELDERIIKINEAISEMIPKAEQAAVASKIFGDEGFRAFQQLSADNIRTAADEIERMGLAISEVDASRIERANDQISSLGLVLQAVGNQLAVQIVPALGRMAEALTRAFEEGRTLRTVFDALIDNLGRIATYVATAVTAFGVRYVGALVAARAATFGLIGALSGLKAALLRSGIGGIAVVAAGELSYRFGRLVSAAGGFGEALSLLGDVAREVFKAIGVSAEGLVPAMNFVWEKVKEGFLTLLSFLTDKWADFLRKMGRQLRVTPGFEGIGETIEGLAIRTRSQAYTFDTQANDANEMADVLFGAAQSSFKAGAKDAVAALERLRAKVEEVGGDTEGAKDAVTGLNAALDALSTGGAAASGGGAADEASRKLDELNQKARQVSDQIKSSFTNAFKGLVTGAMSMGEAVGSVLNKLADMLLDSVGNLLFSGISSFLGGTSLFAPIDAYASGTNYAPGGVALVGERGPELVNLPRGSQVIPNHQLTSAPMPSGGGRTEVVLTVQESETFASTVQAVSTDSATQVVAAYDDQKLPSRIAEFNNDPRLR